MNVENYVFYGYNRQGRHRLAPKTHGGVGILVRQDVLNDYDCEVHSRSVDGVLAIKLHHKKSDYSLVIFAVYLPPENSPWGRCSEDIFAHLSNELYQLEDVDDVIICGDFNARIGELSDIDPDIDSLVPRRRRIDTQVNSHGHAFIDFLIENKMCILNGRSADDAFTCVSPRGGSVIDYVCVPHDTLPKCKNFRVISNVDLVDRHSLYEYIGPRSKLPDHNLLIFDFTTSVAASDVNADCENEAREERSRKRRYILKDVPRDFLGSVQARDFLQEAIQRIENMALGQDHIDHLYDDLVKCVLDEMNRVLPSFIPGKSKKYYRRNKPYWNDDLRALWRAMHAAEEFSKHRGSRQGKEVARRLFKDKAHTFDRALRKADREYRRSKIIEIEQVETRDPRRFWDYLSKLGPKRKAQIPHEVFGEDGNLVRDRLSVLGKWKEDFESLFTRTEGLSNFDIQFYQSCLTEKVEKERQMASEEFVGNGMLNDRISIAEIGIAVQKAKNGKACGTDDIPNEVL